MHSQLTVSDQISVGHISGVHWRHSCQGMLYGEKLHMRQKRIHETCCPPLPEQLQSYGIIAPVTAAVP